jgi:biopolymer transport protein ExbB
VLDILNHSVFLVPVALCWIVAAAITFERVFFLWFRASLNTDVFLKTVQSAVAAGQIDEALRLCLVEPHAPVARVAKAALQYANSDRDELELAVEEATLESVPGLQTRVGYLAMLANVVTLFGLLGTIVGLITSFAAVADANADEKQTMLAQGISLAMYTTAGGISAAIPTLVAYAVLVQKSSTIIDDVERVGARMIMLLLARQKSQVV